MAQIKRVIDLEAHERQLDRIQSFFPRIDSKVSALFAITAGQIAIATLNISTGDLKVFWITVSLGTFFGAAGFVLFELYRCTYPHLAGGHSSLIYFSEIAKLREAEYVRRFSELTDEEYKQDVAAQIWRNSEIVCAKYRYLKRAMIAAMLSFVPWATFLIGTSVLHSQMFKIG